MRNYPQVLSTLRSPQICKSVFICAICGLLFTGCQVYEGFRQFDSLGGPEKKTSAEASR